MHVPSTDTMSRFKYSLRPPNLSHVAEGKYDVRYEMGNWRPVRNKFDRRYSRNYTKHFPISEPEEDFDDRNALYSMQVAHLFGQKRSSVN